MLSLAATGTLLLGSLSMGRLATTYALFTAAAPAAEDTFQVAGHGETFQVSPCSTLRLGTITSGQRWSRQILAITSGTSLPFSVAVRGPIAQVLKVAIGPCRSVIGTVYGAVYQAKELSGDVVVSIGNHFDSIAVPAEISVQPACSDEDAKGAKGHPTGARAGGGPQDREECDGS